MEQLLHSNRSYSHKSPWFNEYKQDIEEEQYVGSISLVKKETPIHLVKSKMYSCYQPMKHAEVAAYRQVDGLQLQPDLEIRNMCERKIVENKYQITEYNRETRQTTIRYTNDINEINKLIETVKDYATIDTRKNLQEDKNLQDYLDSGIVIIA